MDYQLPQRQTVETQTRVSENGRDWTAAPEQGVSPRRDIAWGKYVSVAINGVGPGNSLDASRDGATWRAHPLSQPGIEYLSVATDGEVFVVVIESLFGRVLARSSNGVTWSTVVTPTDNAWSSVTRGNGVFVAVSSTGDGNRVMTSPDGILWTLRSSAADNAWSSVTNDNGLFVAVSSTGYGNRVMTSPDGVWWTLRTSAANGFWTAITHSNNGVFVAVGHGDCAMVSYDGIIWHLWPMGLSLRWSTVTHTEGLFVATAELIMDI